MYTYEINGKKYVQKKLVVGQIGQLAQLLSGVRFMATDPLGLIAALGESLPEALAIVLIPEGTHPADKNMTEMHRDMYESDPDDALQVINDFFDCNPLPSLLQKVTGLIEKFNKATG